MSDWTAESHCANGRVKGLCYDVDMTEVDRYFALSVSKLQKDRHSKCTRVPISMPRPMTSQLVSINHVAIIQNYR